MLGKPVPDSSLPCTGGSNFRLSEQRGKRLVLYFSPDLRDGFGVMKPKSMYGKKVRGIEPSTFVVDDEGKLARAWRGVKVPGHVEEVLSFAKAL
jgi:peroxiredoxin